MAMVGASRVPGHCCHSATPPTTSSETSPGCGSSTVQRTSGEVRILVQTGTVGQIPQLWNREANLGTNPSFPTTGCGWWHWPLPALNCRKEVETQCPAWQGSLCLIQVHLASWPALCQPSDMLLLPQGNPSARRAVAGQGPQVRGRTTNGVAAIDGIKLMLSSCSTREGRGCGHRAGQAQVRGLPLPLPRGLTLGWLCPLTESPVLCPQSEWPVPPHHCS